MELFDIVMQLHIKIQMEWQTDQIILLGAVFIICLSIIHLLNFMFSDHMIQKSIASSTRAAEDRTKRKEIVVKSSVVPQRPGKVMG